MGPDAELSVYVLNGDDIEKKLPALGLVWRQVRYHSMNPKGLGSNSCSPECMTDCDGWRSHSPMAQGTGTKERVPIRGGGVSLWQLPHDETVLSDRS